MKTLILWLALSAPPTAPPVPFQIQTPPPQPRTQHYPGVVRVETHAARFTIAYLPLLQPLPGSVPTTTYTTPTAFALNHVSFPERAKPRTAATRLNRQWLTAAGSSD